jgi:CHASE3 domain sensor protein
MSTLLLAIVALLVNVAVLVFVLKTRKHSRQMEAERQQVRRETDEMIQKFREETKL